MAISGKEAFAKVKSGEWSVERASQESPEFASLAEAGGPAFAAAIEQGTGALAGAGDAIGDVLDPGQDDREKAAREAKEAQVGWDEFQQRYNAGEYTGAELGVGGEGPGQMREYETGPTQGVREVDWVDPQEAAGLGLQSYSMAGEQWSDPSAWKGAESAYSGLGPSEFSGYSSEFANMGPSAYGDLAFDEGALGDMQASGDYYRNLTTTGDDPIAEADFQRRTAAAESSRRANTDAALAQLEQRGQGNANAGLLAELSNQQASVSDQYLAGLDANAMAAARRDSAAGSMADVANMRGQGLLTADTARAGGMDEFAATRAQGMDVAGAARAQGMDSYGTTVAGGQDEFSGAQNAGLDADRQYRTTQQDDWAKMQYDNYYGAAEGNAERGAAVDDRNYDRTWGTGDANTAMYNDAQYYNAVTRPGTKFDQQANLTGGRANAAIGAANTYTANAQGHPDWGSRILQAGANYATASAGKPKT